MKPLQRAALVGVLAFWTASPGSAGVGGIADYSDQRIVDPSLSEADECRAFDIDGDGDLDILAVGRNANLLAWWENADGFGGTWTRRTIDTQLNRASGAWAADLDGDLDLDVIGTAINGDDVFVYRNDGGGLSWTRVTVDANYNGAASVFAIDLDADGDRDIVANGQQGDDVSWFENVDGAGGSWLRHPIDSAFAGATYAAAADFDGDGDPDVLSAAQNSDQIAWYENDGAGGWLKRIVAALDLAASCVPRDMDADGDIDVIGTSFNEDLVAWYENNGDGTAWTEHVVTSTLIFAIYANAADLDFDGDLDILAVGHNQGVIAWYENADGAGTAWQERVVVSGFALATFANAADLNGDGRVDLFAAAAVQNQVLWWPNLGGEFSASAVAIAPPVLADSESAAALRLTLTHAGRAGDDGMLVGSVAVRLSDSVLGALDGATLAALAQRVSLHDDTNASGAYEPGTDLMLADGLIGPDAPDVILNANGGVAVAPGASVDYFVVIELSDIASTSGVTQLSIELALADVTAANAVDASALVSVVNDTTTVAGPIAILAGGQPGDVDGDGDVDLSDLGAMLAAFGACVGDANYLPAADFDQSGCIELSDLGLLLSNFGA